MPIASLTLWSGPLLTPDPVSTQLLFPILSLTMTIFILAFPPIRSQPITSLDPNLTPTHTHTKPNNYTFTLFPYAHSVVTHAPALPRIRFPSTLTLQVHFPTVKATDLQHSQVEVSLICGALAAGSSPSTSSSCQPLYLSSIDTLSK